jgi:hypothetical protein
MGFPQGYRRWRGSLEVPLMWRTSRYVPSRPTKQHRRKLADRRPRTITAPSIALPTAIATTDPWTWATATNMHTPQFSASGNDRTADPPGTADLARGLHAIPSHPVHQQRTGERARNEPTQRNRERRRPSPVDVHHQTYATAA